MVLLAPGSVLRDATFAGLPQILPRDSSIVRLGPATRMENASLAAAPLHGLIIEGGDAVVTRCVVTGSRLDGVRVLAGANVRISDCDIFNNDGFQLINLGAYTVDARGNWWGDANGPGETDLSGAVLFEPFRATPTMPATFGFAPRDAEAAFVASSPRRGAAPPR